MTCNAQALINISRKRLCYCASKETREVWQMVKNEMEKVGPIMVKHMCKECTYRGFCSEMKSCGFVSNALSVEERNKYLNKI